MLKYANRERIAEFALKSRLSSAFSGREFVNVGRLTFCGADVADSCRSVACYVDRILNGAKPADLPVGRLMKFEFAINLNAAKQIDVTMPPNVLVLATERNEVIAASLWQYGSDGDVHLAVVLSVLLMIVRIGLNLVMRRRSVKISGRAT